MHKGNKMGRQINKWFNEDEFSCHDKNKTPAPYIDDKLVEVLTEVREFFGVPVTITSSYRTPEYNKAIGGKEHSHHLYTGNGAAADIQVKGTRPEEVKDFLEATHPDTLGIGSYDTFTHVDVREHQKARWNG